jgi:hypothetical protein
MLMRALWRALQHTLRVPAAATARQVRVDGAIAAVVGLVVIVAGTLLAVGLEKVAKSVGIGRAMLALVFAGYGLLIVGGYRALTGRHHASEQHDPLASLRRIGTGIFVVIAAFGLLFGLLLAVGFVMGWK